MKTICWMLCVPTMIATFAASQVATRQDSLAGDAIAEARKTINDKPQDHSGYTMLATALVNQAQETFDPSYYAQAEEAVGRSLELAPDNFEAKKAQVWILLGEHDYPAALDSATALNRKVPDDVMVYGMLTDADIALGNYKDAETSAQWMLNIRPGNLPALLRAAQLREIFGDAEGAYELLEIAYESSPPGDTHQRASILTKMGHLRLVSGNEESAVKLLQHALTVLSDYTPALIELAEVRLAEKQYQDAALLLQQAYDKVPQAATLYALAGALQLAGRDNEARKSFAEFELKAVRESNLRDNSNRQLIFYFADTSHQPAKALEIAQPEYSWRHDVYTLDAYAWALHVNGRDAEARHQIESALAVGIRDPKLFLHAGEIALQLGDIPAARRYLSQSAECKTADSEQARSLLAGIAVQPSM